MSKLSWKMTPETFVQQLDAWANAAKKLAPPHAGGRRFVRDIRRRRQKWYLKLTGLNRLPEFSSVANRDGQWSVDDAASLSIVIPPALAIRAYGTTDVDRRSRRKRMRQIIHAVSEATDGDQIVLVSAQPCGRRLPNIARASHRGRAELRALYLDSLGVTIMPKLTHQEVTAFQESGALIFPNELIAIDDVSLAVEDGESLTAHLDAIGCARSGTRNLTGKNVVIGILDTGIDPNHPEFSGKQIAFQAFKSNGEFIKQSAKDFGDHGTHVAALAAGRQVGVAPDADLAVAAVLTVRDQAGKMGGYTAQILAGMNWLANRAQQARPVDLINASLGSPNTGAEYYATVEAHRLAGVLTIAAIGNCGTKGMGRHSAPGKLDCAIGVGAVDNTGLVADFSDWGECYAPHLPSSEFKPDIMAPGVAVVSAVPKGRYARKSGTSMASPIVSGAAALLIEGDSNLRQNPDGLCKAILETLVEALPPQVENYDLRRGGKGRLSLASLAR